LEREAEKLDGFPTIEKRTGKKCPPKIATTLMKFRSAQPPTDSIRTDLAEHIHTHVHPKKNETLPT